MTTTKQPRLLGLFERFSNIPLGKQMFSRLVCQTAPYFKTIKPTFTVFSAGHVEVTIPNRRAVHNHIGTVHAIAMCNMCELAGGTMTEVTVPTTHRWIPKGMTVEYLNKAETRLTAIAKAPEISEWQDAMDYPVECNVVDENGTVVVHATINMWVTRKPKKR